MRNMKESGHPWLGKIPANWDVVYPKMLFAQRKDRAQQTDRQLTASQQHGVVYQDEYMEMTGARVVVVEKDFDILKHVEKGDFVISMRSFQGGIEYSDNTGCISSAYVMLIPKKEYVHNRYFKWLLKSSTYINALQSTSNLVRDGQAMRYANFIQVWLPLIPITEQVAIAEILEKKCFEIGALIANEQAQIDKLKAYKQSLITEAVTRGLDSSATLKDSGIEWIGMIPAHWETKRTKHIARKFLKGNGITKDDIVEDGDSPCVRYGEIYTKYNICFDNCLTRTNLSNVPTPQYFENGDLLFVGTGELVEEIGKNVVYLGGEKCLAGGDIIVMQHSEDPLFLSFALNSTIAQAQKSCSKAKLKVVHISSTDIGNVIIPLPPVDEQKQIAILLLSKCEKIDKLILIKQEKIARLEQYKKSLIYEYVTGKKEVQ